VHEGITEAVENRAVEFDLGADERKLDALAQPARNFARHARQRVDDPSQRSGAQFERAALEIAHDAIHPVEADGEFGLIVAAFVTGGSQLAGTQDDFANRSEEAVEGFGLDANRRRWPGSIDDPGTIGGLLRRRY